MSGFTKFAIGMLVLIVLGLTQLAMLGQFSCIYTGDKLSLQTTGTHTTPHSAAIDASNNNNSSSRYEKYIPAPVEDYVLHHTKKYGYHIESKRITGCNIWRNPESTPYHKELQAFREEMKQYTTLLQEFPQVGQDLRVLLKENPTKSQEICQRLSLAPGGLPAIFPSGQLSYTRSGYVEPLLPPMRHPGICFGDSGIKALMRMDYMVHDFEAMCRNLRPDSRTVLIDMGASLDFHLNADLDSPAMYATQIYRKFGFWFDHVYAFEISAKEPAEVFEKVPDELMAAYHWINIGVSADPNSRYNPLATILKKFNKDDFVVIKLDIDTGWIEVPLAYQILNDTSINEKIDQFYFEHHVFMKELYRAWYTSSNGTIEQSLELFHGLREKGVAAHFWP